jgi:hypothetical protein
MSSSASIKPLSEAPPFSVMLVILSVINIGGKGSCGFPGPNILPLAQLMRSSYEKEFLWVRDMIFLSLPYINYTIKITTP